MTVHDSQPSGLTLIEVLLALTLSALVLTTLTGLTRQILITERDAGRRTDNTWQRDAVFAVLQDDLQHCAKNGTDHPIEIAPIPGVALRLITLAPIEGPDATLTARHPARVRYQVEPANKTVEESRLIRMQEDLTRTKSKQNPVRQVIGRRVTSMHVRVFDGQAWQSTWPPPDRKDAVARAIEIRITRPDEERVTVRRLRL